MCLAGHVFFFFNDENVNKSVHSSLLGFFRDHNTPGGEFYKVKHTFPCPVAVIFVEFKAQGVRIGNKYIMKLQPEFLLQ